MYTEAEIKAFLFNVAQHEGLTSKDDIWNFDAAVLCMERRMGNKEWHDRLALEKLMSFSLSHQAGLQAHAAVSYRHLPNSLP